MSEQNITILLAVITAIASLYMFYLEKEKEREADLAKTRKDIYQKFIVSLNKLDTNAPPYETDSNVTSLLNNPQQLYQYIRETYPDHWKNIAEYRENVALLSMYGTNEAVKKASLFTYQRAMLINNKEPIKYTLGDLVLTLRQNIYANSDGKETKVTSEEINQLLTI